MEISVETAVRICPLSCLNGDIVCVQSNTYNNTVQLGSSQIYPVNYALPQDCTQNTLFTTIITPLLNYLMEGCDVSVVAIGQNATGKSYTIFGPELNCAMSESEQGIIPRFLRELFHKLPLFCDRSWSIHITWSQICGENVQDLLGAGSIECRNVSDAFQLIQLGMSNHAPRCAHSLFTITLEQQWIVDGTVQHRISTASFADLAGCEKMLMVDNNGITQSLPTDPNLLALQRCITVLSEPFINPYTNVPYNQSILTTLLKDSFGGRARTLLICCASPFLRDFNETYYTMQFAMRAQTIKNIVTLNSYVTYETMNENMDVFGLQFAANQLFKLVRNAEDLFQKMITNGTLSKNDVEQISEWLTLKQECEQCLSESSEPHRSLERIEEEIEDSFESSESDINCEDEANVIENLDSYISNFRQKTELLISTEVSISYTKTKQESVNSSKNESFVKPARGRRNSIHSADELSSALSLTMSSLKVEEDVILEEKNDKIQNVCKPKILKQIYADLQSCEKQISELEYTIQLKEKLMQQLNRHKDTKTTAKEKIDQLCGKLREEYEKLQQKYNQNQNNRIQQEEYRNEMLEIEQKLQDVDSIKELADDSSRRVLELESSLHTSKKQLEKLKKYKRKEQIRKSVYEQQIKTDTKKSSETQKSNSTAPSMKLSKSIEIDEESNGNNPELNEETLEAYRHEIRNLRRTRELLIEQKCKLDERKQNNKLLSDQEEKKILQYEEAIEGIDLAIEYKNQVICGRTQLNKNLINSTKGNSDDMLLERLLNLNENEMRVLLHKYFDKIVDLRSNGKKLEMQVVDMECQNDNLTCRIQTLSHTLQQVRLQAERRILSLQQQHEDKLHVVMRHLAKEGKGQMVSRVLESSKGAAVVQIAGTSKQIDNSLIARFTRYARHETVPRQLQGNNNQPQTKVTKQKNKIIIQQKNK